MKRVREWVSRYRDSDREIYYTVLKLANLFSRLTGFFFLAISVSNDIPVKSR